MPYLLGVPLALLLLSLTPIVPAASPAAGALELKRFDAGDGLSQASVSVVIQDAHGFLWVGTQDGLNRYDGYTFRAFRSNPLDTNSIAHNHITALLEDRQGNIWVGTWRGLSVLDPETERFTSYYSNPQDVTTLESNQVVALHEDAQGDIWVKTPAALNLFNPQQRNFVRFPHFTDPFTPALGPAPASIAEDREGNLWVGSKDGLFRFCQHLNLFKLFRSVANDPSTLPSNPVRGVVVDAQGHIWALSANALSRYRPGQGNFQRYPLPTALAPTGQPGALLTIHAGRDGYLYLGTDRGLLAFCPSRREYIPFPAPIIEGKASGHAAITAFGEDRMGIMWLGSPEGLLKWNRRPPKFRAYSRRPDGAPLFGNNQVAALHEQNGKLWVGTHGSGLFLLDRETLRTVRFSEQSPAPRWIPSNDVEAIYRNRQGELLLGTPQGILVYNPRRESFSDYLHRLRADAQDLLRGHPIYSLAEDLAGNLWIGTPHGLFVLAGNRLAPFLDASGDRPRLRGVKALARDAQGIVWAGTLEGLVRIDPNTRSMTRYERLTPGGGPGLPPTQVLSLCLDEHGRLWVGSESGLHAYHEADGTFTHYTEAHGLPSNQVLAIESDGSGQVWVGTRRGLAVVNPATGHISAYSPYDGLQGYEFNLGASHAAPSGELFFGGASGLNAFFADSINPNPTVPQVVFTSIEVFTPRGRTVHPAQGIEELVLTDFSLLHIEFSALDFTLPARNQYMYRMLGLSEEWIDLGTKRSATFSHLQEGTYYLQVIGSSSDGVWNTDGVSLRLVVNTRFWESRMAITLYVVLFVLFLILFVRIRTRILRQTHRLLRERGLAMAQVETQREQLMLKNKSITDSITYAKRIQEALMTSEQTFRRLLPESFILHLPKDIVSGDFFWIHQSEGKHYVAVIDCTGHGVPGAFMSIIGVELLRNITGAMGVHDPAEILNRLDRGVMQTFGKGVDGVTAEVKDGMDVSFCILDRAKAQLQYAGAFANLYIVRDSKIIEVKGDRSSVGGGREATRTPYASHSLEVQPNDMVYMFTDGYVDQFGGPEGKKYKFRRFRHLLLNIHHYPLEAQQRMLNDSIREWMGHQEQVDDILIVGFRPLPG